MKRMVLFVGDWLVLLTLFYAWARVGYELLMKETSGPRPISVKIKKGII